MRLLAGVKTPDWQFIPIRVRDDRNELRRLSTARLLAVRCRDLVALPGSETETTEELDLKSAESLVHDTMVPWAIQLRVADYWPRPTEERRDCVRAS